MTGLMCVGRPWRDQDFLRRWGKQGTPIAIGFKTVNECRAHRGHEALDDGRFGAEIKDGIITGAAPPI